MDGLTVFKQLHPIGGHGLMVDEYAEEFDDNSRQTSSDWLVMSKPSFKKHRKHLMLCAITRISFHFLSSSLFNAIFYRQCFLAILARFIF